LIIYNFSLIKKNSEIQVGIWDASNPADTAEWAGGPIDVS
jgi:hypothetical protein